MKINPNFNRKNRKIKNHNLGVFNNKKSCLVDLKPLEETKHRESLQIEKEGVVTCDKISKSLKVNIKIAKNYGFGTYFQNLRESIIDKFLNYDEYISFDGLFKFQSLSDLFNFSKEPQNESISTMKQFQQNQSKIKHENDYTHPPSTNITYNNQVNNTKRNFDYCYEENKELETDFPKSNQNISLAFQNKYKKKNHEYFDNQSDYDFFKPDYSKQNDNEIEYLKKNLGNSDYVELIDQNSLIFDRQYKISNLNNQYFKDYSYFNNQSLNDINHGEINSCMREHSRTKLMNLQKIKDYCSKRKMM